MRWPIRYQLLVPLAILLLGVAGISTWTAWSAAERARQQIETQVRNVAHTLSTSRHVPLTNQTVLEQMKGLSGADYLLLTGDGGRLSTLADAATDLPPAETVVDDWPTLRLGPRLLIGGQAYLGSGVHLSPRADIPDGATLYILYPETSWRSALWEAVRPSLLLGGFGGLASVVLTFGVGQRLSRRVGELERRTRLIAGGDFSPMPLPGRDDELRDLGRSVNEMAEQLARFRETVERTERLRLLGQVSGGLAHQLRNGLTGARLALQLHAREPDGDPEALDVALNQLTLLEAHLKRFLDLGRDGDGVRQPCRLNDLIGQTVALLGPRCKHARIALTWTPLDGPDVVTGDAGQLEQVVLNVVTNALEAAGPDGRVEVVLGREKVGGPLVLEVTDSGPGPPAELVDRLFDPFVTGKPEGVGLGLAVARQVVQAHGGAMSWRRDRGRTCFRVELPSNDETTR